MKKLFLFLLAWDSLFAQGAPFTLQFWHSMYGEKGKHLQEIVTEFNDTVGKRSVPPSKVELQFVGTYEEGVNKLRTSLLARKGPHLIQITDIGTQMMIDSGAISPLYEFAKGDPAFPMKELLAPIRRYYEVNGELYSLPFASSNPILYYNADAFTKAGITSPPHTFDELLAVAHRLTDASHRQTGITWPLHSWFFEEFLARQGRDLVNHDNGRKGRASEAYFNSPEGVRFVTLWQRMVKEGVFANVGRGWEPAEQNFLAGRSAMLITSTSDVFEVSRKVPFRLATAPIPTFDPKIPGGTVVGGNSLWILKDKPLAERQAAYRFLRFMASKPAQRKWHEATGYFPIREDLIHDLEKEGFYRRYPAAKTAIDQMRASGNIPSTHGALMGVFPESREHVESAIEQVLAGRLGVSEALAQAKTRTDEALTRYNRARQRALSE